MKKTTGKNRVSIQAWDAVLAQLTRLLSVPSDAMPCVEVLRDPDLRSSLRRAWADAGQPGKPPTDRLLELLCESKLAIPLPLDELERKARAYQLWQIGFGTNEEPDPLELLQASRPQGVICYFSAVAYHELTTQIPSNHHVAVLGAEPRKERVVNRPHSTVPPTMGRLLFRYASIPYYATQRADWMVAGVERRYLSAKAIVRVTTLEQTLLDTLHRPWNCGGPAVVAEAWERGVERLDEKRLGQYLTSIRHALLTRRTGCMLEHCGHLATDPSLAKLLAKAKDRAASEEIDFLLPAVPSQRLDPAWRLMGIP